MTEARSEDDLPREFTLKRGGDLLRDRVGPRLLSEAETRARDYANARLQELHAGIPLFSTGR